ncbi:MAG: glycerate kinase, partial [Selenomonadaceae bacterium]|nr:glycerate kinase [Selenomonadaceae bacterium]
AKLAKKHHKPVLAFAGAVTRDARELNAHGIDAFFPILRGVSTLDEALDKKNARQNMRDTAEQAMRLIHTGIRR